MPWQYVHREVTRIEAEVAVRLLLRDQPPQRTVDRFGVLALFVRVARTQKRQHGERRHAAVSVAAGVIPVDSVFVELHLAGAERFRFPAAVAALHLGQPAEAGLDGVLGLFGAAELPGVFFAIGQFSQAIGRRDARAAFDNQGFRPDSGALNGGRRAVVGRLIILDAQFGSGCGVVDPLECAARHPIDDHP